mgnify:CR=1 FL=1
MNYKIMNRPMFKMGGSTTPRENYENGTEYPSTSQGFLDSAMAKYRKQQESVGKMGGFDMFKTLARSKDYLQQDTNNPLEYISNIVSNPEFLGEVVLPGMADKKKREMLLNDPKTDLAFAKALKEKTNKSAVRDVIALSNELNTAIIAARNKGEDTTFLEKQIARVLSTDTPKEERLRIIGLLDQDDRFSKSAISRMENIVENKEVDAEGGRVGRQLGSPMMGEQPMQQETQMAGQPGQQEQTDPYQYLRQRLPAEIPDQVVKLIAYNQEAFADFASIETQDDLDSFNKRYNVELVVNV